MNLKQHLIAGLGVAALAVPGAALADNGHGGKGGDHGNGNGNGGSTKLAKYIVKGTWSGDGVVSVDKTNGAARKAGWKGTDVSFDFSLAEINVADKNLDGVEDLGDFVVGDRVRVKARLPRLDPGVAPYTATRLDDRTPGSESDED